MLDRLRKELKAFKGDRPGARFTNLHRRQNAGTKRKGILTTAIVLVMGLALIVLGLLLGLVPGVPGIILGILGVALIATQFKFLAHALDRWEVRLRRLFRRLRRS